MSDLLTPLQWNAASAGSNDLRIDVAPERDVFHWPSPPYASYPPAQALTDPMPCEIVGVNGSRMTGRLTFFMPEQSVANVQIPPSRTTLPLRFDQFRCLTLTTPLLALALPTQANDPHAGMVAQRSVIPFRVTWVQGSQWAGETVGHAETPLGLFLFIPVDTAETRSGAVRRLFVPAAAMSGFEIGTRIGEVLLEQHSATQAQIDDAARQQQQLRDQKLGDILVTRQLVSPEQLLAALEQQAKMPMVRIGEALQSMGMVTQAQLDEALAQQKNDRSVPLGELLVRSGVVSRTDLQTALARKMGYPLVDIDSFPVEADALRKLPYTVAARLLVMPLLVRDGRLIIALDDPVRRHTAIAEVEMHCQMKVAPALAQSRSIEETLFTAYERIGIASGQRIEPDSALIDALATADTGTLVETLEREDGDGGSADNEPPIEQSDNSLVRLINNMIIEAHRDKVSDIHIESYPGKEKIRIRFRKDGLLRTYLELPPNYRSALIARIKIMCDLDISERRKPQDGKINFAKFSPQHKIELRVASIPTNSGLEDVVMRILASAKPLPLDRLGMSEYNIKQLKLAIERPYGMVLCVGPTGSGKTTTLHSALAHINVPERKIWTAEDPIEITQPGLRQVQVNPKIDWTFAKALRAFLRADPDAIMVGEIRDGETAHMAVEASLTGHLVLSTLHTNSAPETVTRLLDMGMDPFNFADSLLAVLAQRLVRRICGECRVSRPATDEETGELLDDYLHAFQHGPRDDSPAGDTGGAPAREELLASWVARHGKDGQLQMHHSAGCDKCDKTGFKGRAGLHELMIISREMRRLVQTGARAEALQRTALSEGMRTLRQDGIDKVLAGVTSIEEVRSMSNA